MRLCGALLGGPVEFTAFDDPASSQWSHACTGGGVLSYPYGDVYDPSICNAAGYGAGATIASGEAVACRAAVTPLALVRDLSGNVAEWEDACKKDKNADDPCHARGGGFAAADPACAANERPARGTARPDLGFRCCS
jgi:formylglycine-generating enzyme required for sulfatase activity